MERPHVEGYWCGEPTPGLLADPGMHWGAFTLLAPFTIRVHNMPSATDTTYKNLRRQACLNVLRAINV